MPYYDPARHHRRSIRLKGYDYTQPGAYFVTMCVQDRAHLFGEVVDGAMVLSAYGRVAFTLWQRIPRHFPHVQLDAFVVMPDHMHGIIVIVGGEGDAFPDASFVDRRDLSDQSSAVSEPFIGECAPTGPPSGSLGAIVGNFKSITTRRINRMRHTPGARVWQRNYHERILRDERALHAVRRYIEHNPARWDEDKQRV